MSESTPLSQDFLSFATQRAVEAGVPEQSSRQVAWDAETIFTLPSGISLQSAERLLINDPRTSWTPDRFSLACLIVQQSRECAKRSSMFDEVQPELVDREELKVGGLGEDSVVSAEHRPDEELADNCVAGNGNITGHASTAKTSTGGAKRHSRISGHVEPAPSYPATDKVVARTLVTRVLTVSQFMDDQRYPEGSKWQDRAACPQTDPEVFFPGKGGSSREAKKVCQSCEVRSECLQAAMDNDERFGIWGGLSERERRRLKRRGSATTPVTGDR